MIGSALIVYLHHSDLPTHYLIVQSHFLELHVHVDLNFYGVNSLTRTFAF